jgi:hypothetical protein
VTAAQSFELDPFSIEAQTGYAGPRHAPSQPPSIGRSTGPGSVAASTTSLTSIRNPVTWFAVFAAATFGLIGFSSSARVGKARVKANLGKE